MSLANLFHFLCAQHVSDINISITRSLRLCCWITTLVVLFSVRCVLEIWCGWDITPTQPHQISNTQRAEEKTTNVVIQQNSRKLLMMDILMSETCWAHKKWNKITSDIKFFFYSSTITMMHGPINIRNGEYFEGYTKNSSIFHSMFPVITYFLNQRLIIVLLSSYGGVCENFPFKKGYSHSKTLCVPVLEDKTDQFLSRYYKCRHSFPTIIIIIIIFIITVFPRCCVPYWFVKVWCRKLTLKFEVLSHPPCSPDLAPSDFHFFPHLKRDLKGTHFTSDDEVKQAVTSWIKQRTPEFFTDGMRKLVLRWEKCIEWQGDYVEK